ncbi:MAG: glycosyltransferase [Nitrospirae bacterium]|nr:glycosyltransferase [Nitrospirota bacterium]
MTSVIIPTLNAGRQIERLIMDLRSQTVSSEVIVVDSSSDDDTADIAASCGARTIVIGRKDFDHGGARTYAGKSARGDVLVFLTQDVVLADDMTLERLLAAFADSRVAASYARQLPAPDASPLSAHLRLFNYPEISHVRELSDRGRYKIRTTFLSNSCAAYRRSALQEIGWFGEDLIFGEDTHAGARLLLAGHRIAYAAQAMVYHSHNYKISEEFGRYFDIGVFHSRENWIIREFGGPGGEGLSYVISAAGYLAGRGKIALFPELMLRVATKFLGYNLGRSYKILPPAVIHRLSMYPGWWKKNPAIRSD